MNNTVTDWVTKSRNLTLRVRNFIDGRFRPVSGVESLEKHGPRDGQLLCRFASGSRDDADDAVASSRRAFEDGRWSGKSVQRRKEILNNLAVLIEAHREELALLDCLDVGKPIADALNFDVPGAAAIIRYSADTVDKVHGRVYASDGHNLSYEIRRPIGVVAGIVGWNFPLHLAAQKIGPALATGNCLILKPSELTSFSAARLAELAVEAGLPEGVLNVIHGDSGVGAALAHHCGVNLVSFTGSTRTGKRLLVASGESNMKRLILECGGKAPNIVFSDVTDLDAIGDAIVSSAFWNMGQVCVSSTRLLVHEGIKQELQNIIVRKTSAVNVGDPLDPQTHFGALVSAGHKKRVLSYIETGMAEGATLIHQSSSAPPFENGFYVPATIFGDVAPERTIAREEIFGPVLSVISFRDENEAIAIANKTIYGLSAIVWTRDLGRAHRVSQNVDAGLIVVNGTAKPAPGPNESILSVGGHKQSGIGVEGGIDGLEAYTSRTTVQFFV